jgi:hypothetical protein
MAFGTNGVSSLQDDIQRWEQINKNCNTAKIIAIALTVIVVALSVILIASTIPAFAILGLASITVSVMTTHDILKMASNISGISQEAITELMQKEGLDWDDTRIEDTFTRLIEGTFIAGPLIRLLRKWSWIKIP